MAARMLVRAHRKSLESTSGMPVGTSFKALNCMSHTKKSNIHMIICTHCQTDNKGRNESELIHHKHVFCEDAVEQTM